MSNEHYQLDLSPTRRCNHKCIYCLQDNTNDDLNEFEKTFEEIENILLKNSNKYKSLFIVGGEVTLRKDLPSIIKCAVENNFSLVHIQTNGTMLKDIEYCKELVSSAEDGQIDFSISLNAHTSELHHKISQRDTFEDVTQGLRNLIKLKQLVSVNVVIMKDNYEILPRLVLKLAELDISVIQFAALRHEGWAGKRYNELSVSISDVIPYLEEAIDIALRLGFKRPSVIGYPFCVFSSLSYMSCVFNEHTHGRNDFTHVEKDKEDLFQKFSHYDTLGTECVSCSMKETCPGIPRIGYAEKYGTSELRSI